MTDIYVPPEQLKIFILDDEAVTVNKFLPFWYAPHVFQIHSLFNLIFQLEILQLLSIQIHVMFWYLVWYLVLFLISSPSPNNGSSSLFASSTSVGVKSSKPLTLINPDAAFG